ncbi:MAG: hypothetical protein AVDCRST_MAG58-774, partial [uncultured Rubrobacteraceae bacterium]
DRHQRPDGRQACVQRAQNNSPVLAYRFLAM